MRARDLRARSTVLVTEREREIREMGVSDNTRGLILAMLSSLFVGMSFILKKKGLRRAAEAGTRAGMERVYTLSMNAGFNLIRNKMCVRCFYVCVCLGF